MTYIKELQISNIVNKVNIFEVDIIKNEYKWLVAQGELVKSSIIFKNFTDSLQQHMDYIHYKIINDDETYIYNILTSHELEVELFLIGI